MTFSEDIKKVLLSIVDDCDGNRAAAAKRLGVNTVTFWMWITGEREPVRSALSTAIDASGAYLVFNEGERKKTAKEIDQSARIEELEKQIEELKAYKNKWEGHLETIRAQSGTDTPIPSEKNRYAS